MKSEFQEMLENCPVIASAKSPEGLKKSCQSESKIIFILFGDICNIGAIVEQIKQAGRIAMVRMDLIAGLNSREISIDFIHKNTRADGIISTKPAQIRRAKELGMFTVYRFFLIDSMAYENVLRYTEQARPDCVEILPGVIPKVIRRMSHEIGIPIIAGGLIEDKEDILSALDSGAVSISTTREKLWFV